MKFVDKIQINPSISFIKDKQYHFIEMANVDNNSRAPKRIGTKIYSSGVKFENGDTVIARIEPCLQNGKGFFVNELSCGFGSTEFLVFRPKDESIDNRFLYYYLQTDYIRKSMIASMSGATGRQRVNNQVFNNLDIAIPSLNIQRRIADVLSAYDDLIENNQKQIKLLEEAAMRLYKEWFIDFRFPEHENTPIVKGVPEGWKLTPLKDHVNVNSNSITKSYNHEHIEYIDISSVSNGRIENKTDYLLKDAPGRAKRLAKDGDTIWGMVRPNLKSYALVLEPDDDDVFSTGFAILTPENIPYTFLYCLVTQDEFVGYLINCTNGAAYPAVKPNHFEEYEALIPLEEILMKFHEITEPLFRSCKKLDSKIILLRQAREKLLPKLLSGEIEV